ncbi:MAG: phosphate signaling complex protein PhoU [Pyrinomonadaceae bacterium]|nr:phosphate signaling complex protein PhoU [Pyrinomonadaceae bacterium]MCX7640120.1 phosphate signaling complex protein PhoU [Pyrinomonadaceae bacterium]MDW8303292.1 phosphate signaling complex protein PhoU [Acidobacteriota bacterium]
MERRILDQQLNLLRDKILLLGGMTEKALHRAVQSLIERDVELAQQVLKDDKIIDQMELDIDRFCIEILALHQPAAHDLRFVISVAKITPILERIADHASSIAEAALVLSNEPQIRRYIDLPLMSEIAAEMLGNALDAFTSENSLLSREVIEEDNKIDACYKRIFDELIEMIIENPSITTSAAHLLFVAKHLERIGDYVKDICELNVYLTEAVFIKHSHLTSNQ